VDKSWKAFERWTAKQFNTTRIPVLGEEDADVRTDQLWIDCKLRVEVPKAYYVAMAAAETLGYQTITFTAQDIELAFLLTRTETLGSLITGMTGYNNLTLRALLPEKPVSWVRHMWNSCPSELVPCVVMSKPRMNYKASLALVPYLAFRQRKKLFASQQEVQEV